MNGRGVQRPSLLVHAAATASYPLPRHTHTHTQYSSLFTPTQAKYGWPSFKKWGFNVNTLYKALFDSVVTTMNSLFCSSRKYIADVVVQTVYCFPVTLTQFAAIQE